MTREMGRTLWAFAVGFIPEESTGPEPEFTSRDELCVLNTGADTAKLSITIYYEDGDPVAPYEAVVKGQRVCHIRVNDLIDPHAVPLGVPYGAVVESSHPVVVQLSRLDTRSGQLSTAIASGFAEDAAS